MRPVAITFLPWARMLWTKAPPMPEVPPMIRTVCLTDILDDRVQRDCDEIRCYLFFECLNASVEIIVYLRSLDLPLCLLIACTLPLRSEASANPKQQCLVSSI